MTKKVQVTKAGLDELKKELNELVNVKRPKVVDRLSNARNQGDLTENSDYHSAKEELEFLDGRIDELEEVLNEAEVVDAKNSHGLVDVGAQVTVKVNGTSHVYNIVGEWEADPMQKKISNTSPLGKALVGKSKGDSVEVEAPVGKVKYEIVSVS